MKERKLTLEEKISLSYKSKHNLFNGVILLVVAIIALICNREIIGTASVKYLLPFAILFIAGKYLYFACKYKDLRIENYLFLLVGSILFLILDLILLFMPITNEENFIVITGVVILMVGLLDILAKEKNLANLINFLLVIVLGTVIIVMKDYFAINYFYLLLILLVVSIISIGYGSIYYLKNRESSQENKKVVKKVSVKDEKKDEKKKATTNSKVKEKVASKKEDNKKDKKKTQVNDQNKKKTNKKK